MSGDETGKRSQVAGLYRLMERYVDGDRRAFGEMHDRLTPRLRGFLMKLVRNESTVDDLVQLTMLKAHLARERFRLQGGDPDGAVQGWYFAIARNVAMDHLRQRSRKEKRTANKGALDDPTAVVADDAPSIEQLATDAEREREIIDRVRDAIAKLPPGQREVVELHKLQGMSMADVAQRLQIREGAVRVRAHRGYKALARLLSPGSGSAAFVLALARILDGMGGQG